MFDNYSFEIAERFMRYAAIDTQSDPQSVSFPSTEKQKDLSRLLVTELLAMGIADAELDPYGYVYATIPSNTSKQVPVICFCAHVDTAPDCSGTGVKPRLLAAYDGGEIRYPDDPDLVLSPRDHPYLLTKAGEDIITASGSTLLGADDKAGVAIIMELARFLQARPDYPHGTIKILFTPDEEIGRGVNKIDLQKLGADFAYTLDGGERGHYEAENFSADGVTIEIFGVSAHPGYAQGKLVNALKVAAYFLELLPKDELSPESTEGRYGFVHPLQMEGIAEKVTLRFIIRDFITARLAAYEDWLRDRLQMALDKFPGAQGRLEVKEQYRNMKEVLDRYPEMEAHVVTAMERAGVPFQKTLIRGGTDGSRLSFMGLPCPNLFTGEMALHGKQEYVSVQDMEKSVETLVHLVNVWEQQA